MAMSLSEHEADVLARLEEQIEVDDPDLAMQFLALEHPALRGRLVRRGGVSAGSGSRVGAHVPRAVALLVGVCAPGVLFGAWTFVSAVALIGSMVIALATIGTMIAERGEQPSSRHPSRAG
jgi:hypothetical protein